MRMFLIPLIGSTLFATLAVAEHKWPISNDYYAYRGPPAPLSSDGRVMDTAEVAHARAAHLATHAQVAAQVAHNPHQVWEESYEGSDNTYEGNPYTVKEPRPYQGPPAPLGHDGRVIDTPEIFTPSRSTCNVLLLLSNLCEVSAQRASLLNQVAEAKAAHLAAHARAAAKATPDYDYHGMHNDVWDDRANHHMYVNHQTAGLAYAHHAPMVYRGPPAPLAPDGRVVDTPEVAQAKEAHLRAYAYAAALSAHRGHELYY